MKCILQILLFIKILSITFSQIENSTAYGSPDYENSTDNENSTDISEGPEGNVSKEEDTKEHHDPETCGEPPLPEHAKVSKGNGAPYQVNSTVSYSCDFGYSADGASHTATCVKSAYSSKAVWTDTAIACIPRSCGDPGYVPNAHRVGSLFTFPNSISFECDEGYQRQGSAIHYCQVNGKWSGSLPSCEKIECDVPEDPQNGRVTYTSLEYASELKYECDKGFILKNYEPRICFENGIWSGDEPVCQESQCETPVHPLNGNVTVAGDGRRVGSLSIYKCHKGFVLVGSAVSKCLEIGQWTFPTPKCVAPCSVPEITNGYIGFYEYPPGYYNQQQFKRIAPNTQLEDGAELYLRCDSKYEPLGKPAVVVKISCAQGIWKEDPVCLPAKCHSPPPLLNNSQISSINNEHNGTVVYRCKQFYNKTQYGNITCVFGKWTGYPPTCSDTRCYVKNLPFPGVFGQRNEYQNGDILIPTCGEGYIKTKTEQQIVCDKGHWTVSSPPCVEADCLKNPPSQPHGTIKSYSGKPGSTVIYECNAPYIQQTQSEVRCQLGEWVGSPPLCMENGCYYQNLKEKTGVARPLKDPVKNGEELQVECRSGYIKTNSRPKCSWGTWKQDDRSPCIETRCYVQNLKDKTGIARPLNGYIENGYELKVKCRDGFNPTVTRPHCSMGTWMLDDRSPCSENKLIEETDSQLQPVDEPVLDKVDVGTAASTLSTDRTSVTSFPTPSYVESSASNPKVEDCVCTYQGSKDLIAYVGNDILKAGNTVYQYTNVTFQCKEFGQRKFRGQSSIYCADCGIWSSPKLPDCDEPSKGDLIISYHEDKIDLYPNDVLRVKEGENVSFYCFISGFNQYPKWNTKSTMDNAYESKLQTAENHKIFYYRVLTIYEASFQNDAQYTCVWNKKHKRFKLNVIGRLIVVHNGNIIPGYTITAKQGANFTVSCHGVNAVDSPIWSSSVNQAHWHQITNFGNQYIYESMLIIQNATYHHNGIYNCTMERFEPTYIRIEVQVRCRKFAYERYKYLEITYTNKEHRMNSQVIFACKNSTKQLEGSQNLTCLPEGVWSGQPPQCIVQCQKYPDNGDLEITYSNKKQKVNSQVKFACKDPIKHLEGSQNLTCLPNGHWSGQLPQCVVSEPTYCKLADITPLLPPKLTVDSRDVKEDKLLNGSVLNLNCKEQNMVPAKPSVAKCESNGQWTIPDVKCIHSTYTCEPPNIPVENTVIVSPQKDSYSFGDHVTFFCPPGKKSDLRYIVCIENGWSSSEIPECIN